MTSGRTLEESSGIPDGTVRGILTRVAREMLKTVPLKLSKIISERIPEKSRRKLSDEFLNITLVNVPEESLKEFMGGIPERIPEVVPGGIPKEFIRGIPDGYGLMQIMSRDMLKKAFFETSNKYIQE